MCVSPSLMKLSVEGGYIPAEKAAVVGAGTSNGVDTNRYQRSEKLHAEGVALLASRGVAPDAPLIGFVGRLAWDKGVTELLDAFEIVKREVPNAKLALLGGDLADEVAEKGLVERVKRTEGVVTTGTVDLAPYYARIDVLAAPTYREGFPNVVLEAASSEVPTVGFRSTGVVDAIADGETGALVSQGDVGALAKGLVRYLKSFDLARAHGRAARMRAIRLWECRIVWSAWLEIYRERLAKRGLPLPDVRSGVAAGHASG
jgi:glycosyltransferase involved in cell wall biosynthesis